MGLSIGGTPACWPYSQGSSRCTCMYVAARVCRCMGRDPKVALAGSFSDVWILCGLTRAAVACGHVGAHLLLLVVVVWESSSRAAAEASSSRRDLGIGRAAQAAMLR